MKIKEIIKQENKNHKVKIELAESRKKNKRFGYNVYFDFYNHFIGFIFGKSESSRYSQREIEL